MRAVIRLWSRSSEKSPVSVHALASDGVKFLGAASGLSPGPVRVPLRRERAWTILRLANAWDSSRLYLSRYRYEAKDRWSPRLDCGILFVSATRGCSIRHMLWQSVAAYADRNLDYLAA